SLSRCRLRSHLGLEFLTGEGDQNMKRPGLRSGFAVALAVGVLSGCAAQPAQPGMKQPAQSRMKMNVDPQADEALHRMSNALGNASTLSFQATAHMDEHIAPGQLAQSTRQVRVVLRRPDRLYVESHQGEDVWVLWYQGSNLTLLDKTANTYSSV